MTLLEIGDLKSDLHAMLPSFTLLTEEGSVWSVSVHLEVREECLLGLFD
jgi:hypothetical protein